MSVLTVRQQRFCEHYAADPNITKAAEKAGYSAKTAYSIGQRLLKKVEIQNHLKQLTGKKKQARILSAIQRQEWLSKIVFGEVYDSHVTSEGEVVKRPARLADKIKAVELLCKMRGEFINLQLMQHKLDNEPLTIQIRRFFDEPKKEKIINER